jgi:hypothetical protein
MTKKNNIMENFTKWQNYTHYLLLTIGIVTCMHFQGIHIFHTANFLPNWMFLRLYGVIFVLDTLVHLLFCNLPKKYRWCD